MPTRKNDDNQLHSTNYIGHSNVTLASQQWIHFFLIYFFSIDDFVTHGLFLSIALSTEHMEHAQGAQLQGIDRITAFVESLITKSDYCQCQRLVKAKYPQFRACVLAMASRLMRSTLDQVLRDIMSAPRAPVRRVPAFLNNATAVRSALQEFASYINDTMIPLCERITQSSPPWSAVGPSDSVSASQRRTLRGFLSRQFHAHICQFLESNICNDMYILSYIWQRDSTFYKKNRYTINSWYQSQLRRLEHSQWVVVSEDEEAMLLHHSLLPHPDHLVKVRKERTPAENTWAAMFKLPESEGPESLLLFCGFKNNTRLPPVPDGVVIHSEPTLSATKHVERKGVHFDDYDAFLSKATAEIDKVDRGKSLSTPPTGGGGRLKGRKRRATKTRNDYSQAHMEKMQKSSCLSEEDAKE